MFDLTHQERQVIIFLIVVAFIGITIDLLLKRYSRLEVIACVQQDAGRININQADTEELKSLPGIGEKLAQAIVDYRNSHGAFKEIAELKNIKGIYPSRFEKIKSFVVLQ